MYRNVKGAFVLLFILVLVACGGGGGGGGGNNAAPDTELTDPLPQTDTTAPAGYSVSFGVDSIDLSNQNNLDFTLVDAESGTSYSYSITSSAGGSAVNGTGAATQATVIVGGIDVSGLEDGTLSISIVLRDAAGNSGLPATDSVEKVAAENLVQVSGALTFDLIFQAPRNGSLDYGNIQPTAIRGVLVEAVDRAGAVLNSGESDASGNYSLDVPKDTEVQVRVKAQIPRSETTTWDVRVTDNTSNDALYVLAGSFADTGSEDSSRDLHAASGWEGNEYDKVRAAAPFSILYYLYDGLHRLRDVQPDLALPDLEVRWSIKNNPAEGLIADGDLGSSFYNRRGAIYLLGKENVDTEEYDPFVILHELGHFLQDALSRDDSIGGSHNVVQYLDFRVAFSEGVGNAIAAILLDDPFYRDSGGILQQGTLARFDIEKNPTEGQGWFVESSVQAIIYDVYDAANDGIDSITLGLEPILKALMSEDLINSPWFVSIYTFLQQLNEVLIQDGTDLNGLETLVHAQQIFGVGPDGLNETNAGDIDSVLPLYNTITVSGAPTILCSVAKNGIYNKLGNRAFARLTIVQQGEYSLRMERISGRQNRDPDFTVRSLGAVKTRKIFENEGTDLEVGSTDLEPGQYIIEAFDYFNTEEDQDTGSSGSACYEFSVLPGEKALKECLDQWCF